MLIDFVVKHQNSFVYFNLFKENFIDMLAMGNIDCDKLLNSDIFYHQFDFMEWPAIHCQDTELLLPYNGSISNIRYMYEEILQNHKDILE